MKSRQGRCADHMQMRCRGHEKCEILGELTGNDICYPDVIRKCARRPHIINSSA